MTQREFSIIETLDRLCKWIWPPKLNLSPLEQRLYVEALRKLPRAAAMAVDRQMKAYNLAQRDGYKKMTLFFSIRRGRADFPDALRFPDRSTEFKFASIKFRVPGDETLYRANLWAYGGRFTRMTFNNTIADIMNRDDIEILKTTVRPEGLV
jgi:hypothetical protein